MSDAPQGPGWWLASDGRYYPPQPVAAPAPPAPPVPAPPAPPVPPPPAAPAPGPMPPQPMGAVPMAPAAKSGNGCLYAVLIGVVVMLVGGVAGFWFLGRAVENVTEDAFGSANCSLVSKEQVESVVGGTADLVQLGGLTAFAGIAIDSRVIPDGTTCWATMTGSSKASVVRIARKETADGASAFEQELTKAKGSVEDRGNGLSVETSGYFLKDGTTGDQSFCTSTDLALSSGALVRSGNTLTYVSILPVVDGSTPPDLGIGSDGKTLVGGQDETNCQLAQDLIAKMG